MQALFSHLFKAQGHLVAVASPDFAECRSQSAKMCPRPRNRVARARLRKASGEKKKKKTAAHGNNEVYARVVRSLDTYRNKSSIVITPLSRNY